jgi:large subunit ribosomal protein L7e
MKINEVQANILKKRKARQVSRAKQFRDQIKKTSKTKGFKKFIRAEKFVKEELKKRRDGVRLRRNRHALHETVSAPKEDSPRLLIIVRTANEMISMSDIAKKALKNLRLTHQFHATFALNTPDVKKVIKIAEPFITYGEPSLRTVKELLSKRGYLKVLGTKHNSTSGKPQPLMDNAMIEEHLGSLGIICVEDLVHELYSRGPNFEAVNSFVGKFKLGSPSREEKDKKPYEHFDVGGSFGYRGDKINAYLATMI